MGTLPPSPSRLVQPPWTQPHGGLPLSKSTTPCETGKCQREKSGRWEIHLCALLSLGIHCLKSHLHWLPSKAFHKLFYIFCAGFTTGPCQTSTKWAVLRSQFQKSSCNIWDSYKNILIRGIKSSFYFPSCFFQGPVFLRISWDSCRIFSNACDLCLYVCEDRGSQKAH